MRRSTRISDASARIVEEQTLRVQTSSSHVQEVKPSKSTVSSKKKKKRVVKVSAAPQTYFRLLDLPLEIQEIIYEYCYGDIDLLLTCHYGNFKPYFYAYSGRGSQYSPGRENPGGPRAYIHQTSRRLARDAGKIWRRYTGTITITSDEEYDDCIRDFCMKDKYNELKHRLLSLTVDQSGERPPAWARLIRSCPKLQDVKFFKSIHSDEGDTLPGKGRSRKGRLASHLCDQMGAESKALSELEYLDLSDLVWIFEQANRYCKVTALVDYHGIWDFEEQAEDPWGRHVPGTSDICWEILYSSTGHTITSRKSVLCLSEESDRIYLQGKWLPEMSAPMIAYWGSEDWQEMRRSSRNGKGEWKLPSIHKHAPRILDGKVLANSSGESDHESEELDEDGEESPEPEITGSESASDS